MVISEIMEKAQVEDEYSSEVQDIVDELIKQPVIEFL